MGLYRTTFPIEVPPYHGLEPNLRLVYNSSGGNGVAGDGWNLAGTSTIRRASPGKGAPRYDKSDIYLLDGLELIPCSNSTDSPSCKYQEAGGYQAFTTRIESYQRIAFDPNRTSGGTWYVWSKTGTRATYESRCYNGPAGHSSYAWDVVAVEDTLGNKVSYGRFCANETDGLGETYLDLVAYNGNTIKLYYEPRPDVLSYAIGGDLVFASYRLKSIDVLVGKERARAYQLVYDTSHSTGRSILQSVQQFGKDARICTDKANQTCAYGSIIGPATFLPAHSFETQSLAAGQVEGPWLANTTNITAGGAFPSVGPPWAGNPNYDDSPYQTTVPSWLQSNAQPDNIPRYRFQDLNGDSRADILALRYVKESDGIWHQFLSTAYTTKTGYTFHDFDPDPSGVDQTLGIHEDYLTGDFDGDGQVDVMQLTNDKRIQVWRAVGDGSFTRTVDHPVTWPYLSTIASCFSFAATVSAGIPIAGVSASWNIYSSCNIDLPQILFVGDVNRDGKADFMMASQSSANTVTLHTALSSGNDVVVMPDVQTPWSWFDTNTKKDRFFPADVNGDGRTDFVHIAFHKGGTPGDPVSWDHDDIDVAFSNGDGTFALTSQHTGALWDDESRWFPGDVNGDGKADIINVFKIPADATMNVDRGGIRVGFSTGSDGMFRWVGPTDTGFPWYRPAPFGDFTPYLTTWMVGDIDGDLKTDVVNLWDDNTNGNPTMNMAVAFPRTDSSFEMAPNFKKGIQPNAYLWQAPEFIPAYLGELNGDGKQDLLQTPWRQRGSNYPLDLLGYLSPNRGWDMFNWRPTDVNGDGRQDLVYVYYLNPGYRVYTLLHGDNDTYTRKEQDITPLAASIGLNNPDTTGWMLMDTGSPTGSAPDGRADLVYVDHQPNSRLTIYTLMSNGDGTWTAPTGLNTPQTFSLTFGAEFPPEYPARHWLPLDVNGDGLEDLVTVIAKNNSAYIHTIISNGNGTWSWTISTFFNNLAPFSPLDWRAVDVNGDGRGDLVMTRFEGSQLVIRTLLSNGNTLWSSQQQTQPFAFMDARNWLPFEANGDGMTDLAYVDTQTSQLQVDLLVSKGDGQWQASDGPTIPVPAGADLTDTQNFRPMDVNDDGRTDLVHLSTAMNAAGFLETSVLMLSNLPSGWTSSLQSGIPFQFADLYHWRMMDTNSDGITDLVYIHPEIHTLTWANLADRMVAENNGLGGKTKINYQPSSSWTVNRPQDGCYLPLGQTWHMVSSATVSDGRTADGSQSYVYECAHWSYQERAFLGWTQVATIAKSSIQRPASVTLNHYQIDDTCLARPSYREVHDDSGKSYNKTIIAYLDPGAAPPFHCLVNYQDNIELDQHIDGLNSYTYYHYDEFGNIDRLQDLGNPDTPADDRVTERTYLPATGPYIVGLVSSETIRAGADASGKPEKVTMFCYDGDTSLTCAAAPTKGLLTRRTELNMQGLSDLASTDLFYDSYGNLAGVRDPNKHGQQILYDQTYHIYPVSLCNALNQCDQADWDYALGQPTARTDANNQRTEFDYDSLSRLVETRFPDGGKMQGDYLDWGDPAKQRVRERMDDGSVDGLWVDTYFDGLGRNYQSVQKGNSAGTPYVQSTVYVDASSQPNQISYWYRQGETPVYEMFTYDPVGRVVQQTHPDGAMQKYIYRSDKTLSWVAAYDELGNEKILYHDAQGRLSQVSERNHGYQYLTKYTYNSLDQLTGVTDAANNQTTYTFDLRGRKTGKADPDMGSWSYGYDLVGDLQAQTDARKLTIRYTYDELNRIKTKTYPDGRTITWNYDEAGHGFATGRLTSITDSAETRCPNQHAQELTYDTMGQVTWQNLCVEGTTAAFAYQYDQLGRLQNMTYPDSEKVTYGYNDAGQLKSLSGYVLDMTYSPSGSLTSVKYSNGTQANYSYDPKRQWLISASVMAGRTRLYQAGYTHLANGLISGMSSRTNKMNLAYQYDDMNRLTGISGDYNQTLNYDSIGNITFNDTVGTYSYMTGQKCGLSAQNDCPHAVQQTLSLDTKHMQELHYDDNGNLTLVAQVDNGARKERSIEWNADNQPVVIQDFGGVATNVRYDAAGQRVYRERTGQVSLYFGGYLDMAYPSAGGTIQKTQYYYAGPLLVARKDASGTYWYHQDHLGSPRLLTNQSGRAAARYDYQPFGLASGGTINVQNDIQFTGQRTDADNGLIYMNARYYDPQLARFISADSILSNQRNPQALNRYSYVENNPISFTDPTGHDDCVGACTMEPEVIQAYPTSDPSEWTQWPEPLSPPPLLSAEAAPPAVDSSGNEAALYYTPDELREFQKYLPPEEVKHLGPPIVVQGKAIDEKPMSLQEAIYRGLGGKGPFVPGPRPLTQLDILAGGMLAETAVVFSGGAALELMGGGAVLGIGESGTAAGVSSGVQGRILGWGTGQTVKAVAQTRAVTAALTAEKVREMIAQGLDKGWVEEQLTLYNEAVQNAAKLGNNAQLLPRKELMEKILSLWPN